jgi:hypothetical protein
MVCKGSCGCEDLKRFVLRLLLTFSPRKSMPVKFGTNFAYSYYMEHYMIEMAVVSFPQTFSKK